MSRLSFHNGRVLAGDRVLDAATLSLSGALIGAVADAAGPADQAIDLDGGWLLPGFIDAQVNGGAGVLFNDQPSVDGIARIAAAHARFGTTALLPTLISAEPDTIVQGLDAVDAAIDAGVPGVVGIHVEGPFINAARKGIHHPDRIRRLDERLVALLCRPRRGVVMLTLAPEQVDAADLTRLAATPGVVLSAGHTDATYEQAVAGFRHGIRGVTHLFNAMSPLNHRAPGMVGAALDEDAWCGLIADDVHVAPAALRLAWRAKGADRLMLVTDAMPSVGHDAPTFTLDGRAIRVADGRCVDDAGTLAGAHLDMAQALRTMAAAIGGDVVAASRMASGSPAAFLGLGADRGRIAAGMRADLAMLDRDLRPVATWIGGVRQAV